MNETEKCYKYRLERGDFDKYLRGDILAISADALRLPSKSTGKVTPIGATEDFVKLSNHTDAIFDCVYSSHCLEHIPNIGEALIHWARVIKPGGFMYLVVPDYSLYELEQWPPIFNSLHKQSFSQVRTNAEIGRDSHHNIFLDVLPFMKRINCDVVYTMVEDYNYDYSIRDRDQTVGDAVAQICTVWRKNG